MIGSLDPQVEWSTARQRSGSLLVVIKREHDDVAARAAIAADGGYALGVSWSVWQVVAALGLSGVDVASGPAELAWSVLEVAHRHGALARLKWAADAVMCGVETSDEWATFRAVWPSRRAYRACVAAAERLVKTPCPVSGAAACELVAA